MKMQKSVIYAKKKIENEYLKDKKYCNVTTDHCHYAGEYRGAADSICSLNFGVPIKNPISFHNGSTYDYHFIIKELEEKFRKNYLLV